MVLSVCLLTVWYWFSAGFWFWYFVSHYYIETTRSLKYFVTFQPLYIGVLSAISLVGTPLSQTLSWNAPRNSAPLLSLDLSMASQTTRTELPRFPNSNSETFFNRKTATHNTNHDGLTETTSSNKGWRKRTKKEKEDSEKINIDYRSSSIKTRPQDWESYPC